jgi:PEGA domain
MVMMKSLNERSRSMQLCSAPSALHRSRFAPSPVVLMALSAMLTVFPAVAVAEPGVLAVRSKGKPQEKSIAVQAVTEAVTRAGWTLTPRAFSPQVVEALVKCLPTDQPWPCLVTAAGDETMRRLAVLSLESQPTADGTPMTVVTVQAASAELQDAAHGARRYCQPCSPDLLARLTTEAAKEVLEWMHLKSGKTFLEVKSRPFGAIVSVDGKRLGVTDAAFPIMPGTHRVLVTHPKYPAETRTIEVKENKTAVVIVVFGSNNAVGGLVDPARAGEFREGAPVASDARPPLSAPSSPSVAEPRRSLALPVAFISIGAAVLAGGVVALAVDEDDADLPPDPKEPQEPAHRNTAPLGVGLIIGGALAAGAGGWLLWQRGSAGPRNPPIAGLSVQNGGATFSFARSF